MKMRTPMAWLLAALATGTPAAVRAQEHPGEVHYRRVCSKCHDKGKGTTPAGRGAPRLGDARAWESRVAKGIDQIYKKVIGSQHGKADEPHDDLKNFRADLSDEQVRSVIEYMFEQVP
jgi:cytochrome c5